MPEQTLNQTMAQATLRVYLCTSGPFLLLIQSHCYLGLCQTKCPCDDSRSVCHQHLLLLAPACSGLTLPPAFVIWSAGPDATCCTPGGREDAAPGSAGRFTSAVPVPPDWEVTDWSLIRGTGIVSVLD